jgi:ABC-2 type transport system permease protein
MIPVADDLLRIAVYFGMALLYLLVFFAFSTAMSTIAKSSSMSILYILGVVITLFLLSMFAYNIAGAILGPAPEYPILYMEGINGGLIREDAAGAAVSSVNVTDTADKPIDIMPVPPVDDEYQKYWERQTMIINAINAVSPISNFGDQISNAILSQNFYLMYDSKMPGGYGGYGQKTTVWDSLASIWANILVLVIQIVVSFAIAYIAFLRSDIR